MNGDELSGLIQQRWEILKRLLEISRKQMLAIESGQMSDLMRILSQKQRPLNDLLTIADQLRVAMDDDPERRHWPCTESRQRCRERQNECEQMHLELLAIEAECESTLSSSRQEVQDRLAKVDAGWQAASGYAERPHAASTGGRLDLSSDR